MMGKKGEPLYKVVGEKTTKYTARRRLRKIGQTFKLDFAAIETQRKKKTFGGTRRH